MKKLILLILAAIPAFGQGGLHCGIALKSTGVPASGASIRVCTSGATGTPCSPTASIYSDAALGNVISSLSADSGGNYCYYTSPGFYKEQVTIGQASSTQAVQIAPDAANLTTANIAGGTIDGATLGGTTPLVSVTTKAFNSVEWAGPGAIPTIDAAVTACGSNPCTVYISQTYSGADSSLLISLTGTGYKYYNGPSNVSIVDLRASTDITINYPMKFGGKSFAQFSRFGVTQNCASPTDSCVGAVFANVVSGTMPNTGSQTGGVSTLITTGTLNTSSGQAFIGHESFVSLQHTGGSTPNIPNAYGYTSSINLEGSGTSAFTVARAVGYTATTFTNTRTNATAAVAYGFDALAQTIGTSENYGYHNWGNWLSDNGTSFDWADTGGSPRHIITVTNDTNSKTIFQNANDTAGTEFETIGGSGLFHVGSGLLISRTLHQFTNGGIALTAPWVSTVAPTISSGFGTSPSIAKSNGTGAFTINVGTGGTATNGVIALPTITDAWKCTCNDITTQSTTVFICKQKATSASSATIANYTTAGAEGAWVASDIVQVSCLAY